MQRMKVKEHKEIFDAKLLNLQQSKKKQNASNSNNSQTTSYSEKNNDAFGKIIDIRDS